MGWCHLPSAPWKTVMTLTLHIKRFRETQDEIHRKS